MRKVPLTPEKSGLRRFHVAIARGKRRKCKSGSAEGSRNPCVIKLHVEDWDADYLPVTLRPLISVQKGAVLSLVISRPPILRLAF